MTRSVSAEITLNPGRYYVLMKVTALRNDGASTEDAVRQYASKRRQKLFQIGVSYDLAHAKGLTAETETEKQEREEREQHHKAVERAKLREETKRRMQKEWIRKRKLADRQQRQEDILAGRRPSPKYENPVDETAANQTANGGGPVHAPTDSDTNGTRTRRLTVQTNGFHVSKWMRNRHGGNRPSLDTRLATNCLESRDIELLEGFEFDSDIDMPPEEPADSKTHLQAPGGGSHEDSSDAWNAVCVVGLRVYSKDPQLSLQVVHPAEREDDVEAALDMDDPAASATAEFGSWSRRGF